MYMHTKLLLSLSALGVNTRLDIASSDKAMVLVSWCQLS